MWFAAFLPPSPISGISPHIIPSHPPHTPTVSPLVPSNWPQCVKLPSLWPRVPIVQHQHMSDTIWCLIFCSCVSLLRMMVSRFFQIHLCPYKGHKLIPFYGCTVFHGVYVPHFLCPVYHWWAFGLAPGLCYCKQCLNEHMCMCLYNIMIYNLLGIYPVMVLLGQMEFLFLRPWGIATLSSTMVELIYTPTNSVELFLFLHILSSICCLQIFYWLPF